MSESPQLQGSAVQPTSAYSNLRRFVRQNSESVGLLAENVVLPMNKRSAKIRSVEPEVETINLQQMEHIPETTPTPYSQPPPYATTVVLMDSKQQAVQKPMRPEKEFPLFMIAVSIVQVALFYNFSDESMLLIFGYDPFRRHELWRFVTIMLAHSSTSHLWGNVIFQLILGVLLEMVHGQKRICIIYMASVLGGSLFITLMGPTSYGVGASAGVYGLLFAHLSTIILNWNEMDRKCCRLFWLLLYIGFDIGINAWVQFGLQIETNTSHAGHLGGAVTGFLVAIIVLKNFQKHPWEKKLQKFCGGLLIGLFTIILLVNLSFPSYYLDSEFNFDYADTYVKHVLRLLKESPEDSAVRKLCEADEECKRVLDHYIHNGTIPQE